ncbi:ABC transporter permease [Spirochaeta africana]|nr:MlaE family lipid ABC transporter permease subunit [Spirochaeta africana]
MQIEQQEGTVRLVGRLDYQAAAQLHYRFQKQVPDHLDLSRVTALDPAGALFLQQLLHRHHRLRTETLHSLPEQLRQIYTASEAVQPGPMPVPQHPRFLERTGAAALARILALRAFFQLAADSLYWSITGIFHPQDRRSGSVIAHCFTMGVEAVGIIGLLSAILGFILALQAAIQLQQFGAGMLVADLIALALIHEMGPIMTSIIVAGRTGSATASEIATMRVTEELEALKVMGLHPVKYVVVPKLMAITLVMPLLLTLAITAGVLGGAVIGMGYLDIHPTTYLQQSASVILLRDLVRSYSKTVVFAWVIVLIGAHFGFQVEGGAEGVGRATTKSVVAAIFAVLVLDALFSLTLL